MYRGETIRGTTERKGRGHTEQEDTDGAGLRQYRKDRQSSYRTRRCIRGVSVRDDTENQGRGHTEQEGTEGGRIRDTTQDKQMTRNKRVHREEDLRQYSEEKPKT